MAYITINEFESLADQYHTLYMGYTNANGDYNEMNISNIGYPSGEYGWGYFEACCVDDDGEMEDEARTFKISRINFIEPSNDFDEDYEN